jgi:subtilase family serine protease
MIFSTVVSVGGTYLWEDGAKYKEWVWDGTGSGCATGISKPDWQRDPDCPYRTDNDIAAVPFNVAEYDTYNLGGWITVGGTSVSSPLIGGIFGLAGNASSYDAGKTFWTLKKRQLKQDFHQITVGNNGSCDGEYLCTAGTGQFGTYSGPPGWGTPNGIGAF